jgi:hypothetical protein
MKFKSITRFQKLMKTRADLSFWAENIMECEALCVDNHELKHFFAYITNPHLYDYETVEKSETMGDLEKRGELLTNEAEVFENDDRQEAEVFKNGIELKIFVRNKPGVVEEEHDEKKPE